ncbi:hypothetical protein DFH09DRAFT_1103803 [Mycena vulgaris]|nr:hypothetical protein DFH09DRAFT_1103803 [Mycena vulgaris]
MASRFLFQSCRWARKRRTQLAVLIAEKDREARRFPAQDPCLLLITYCARDSHKFAPNFGAGYADSVQCDHASELAAEIQAKERLRDTLTRYLDIVKVAEIERDDLRDAVIELAEKTASGFSGSWPLHIMPNDLFRLISEHDLWAYASGMITFLRDSLASERRAHAEKRTAARARIALLEAQIARRDAELEHFPARLVHPPPNIPVLSPSPPPIPTADVENALHLTVAQNVALEEELEYLAVLLEQGRVGASRLVPPSVTRRLESAIPDVVHQAPARPLDSGRRKRDRHTSHPRDARQRRSRSGSRARRRHSSSPRSELGDPDRTIRPDVMHAVRSAPENMHASLDREIAVLGAKIDEFQIENKFSSHRFRLRLSRRPSRRSTNTIQVGRYIRQRLPLPPPSRLPIESPVRQRLLEVPVTGPGRLFEGKCPRTSPPHSCPPVMLPLAGPSSWVFNPPPMRTPPIGSTEISPLDLSSDCSLLGAPSPPEGTDTQTWGGSDAGLQPGKQAVQELMDIAARRRGS